jgi:predicted nucleic acid-binding protein
MNGNNSLLLLDTNIVLYYLNGDDYLATILEGNFIVLSFITEFELLSYKHFSKTELEKVTKFIRNECLAVDVNYTIKQEAIDIRKKHQLKLPDSIIAATARSMDVPLLTADKVFKRLTEVDIYFYQI